MGLQHLKARRLERRRHLLARADVGQAVADLDSLLALRVLLLALVVGVRHAPFVAGEHAAGLEHAQDLLVAGSRVGRVAGGLDLVHRIKGVGLLGDVHEVGLHEAARGRKARLGVQDLAARDLVRIVVQADHVGAGELGDLAQGPTHAATHVQHLHAGLQLHLEGEVVLVALDALHVRLAGPAVRKVEGLPPAVLVEGGGQVVVLVHHVRVVALALLLALRAIAVVIGVARHRGVHLPSLEFAADVGRDHGVVWHIGKGKPGGPLVESLGGGQGGDVVVRS
mmetsp:Transcript_30095/g.75853  ORF Transcript_30095/g.75853 Transcript_30095/m.75853 type:complete len:281 (-) Transcript_30095:2-844(-)